MAAGFNPRLLFWATIDQVKGMLGMAPLFIRAVGRPNEFALLNSPSALPGIIVLFFFWKKCIMLITRQGSRQCSLKEIYRLMAPRTL